MTTEGDASPIGGGSSRRRALVLVATAVVLLIAAVVVVVLSASQVEDEYRDVLAACASGDIPDDLHCGGDEDSAAAALDHGIGPIDTSVLAAVLVAGGIALLASFAPARGGMRALAPIVVLLVVQFLLVQLYGAFDYKSCDEPGYNDAGALRVIAYDVTVLVILLWPIAAAVLAIARLVATRRGWLVLLATVSVAGVTLVVSAFLLVAASSC